MTIEERLAHLEALLEHLTTRLDDHMNEEESRSDILTARLEREDDKMAGDIYRLENQVSRLEQDLGSISRRVDALHYASR